MRSSGVRRPETVVVEVLPESEPFEWSVVSLDSFRASISAWQDNLLGEDVDDRVRISPRMQAVLRSAARAVYSIWSGLL